MIIKSGCIGRGLHLIKLAKVYMHVQNITNTRVKFVYSLVPETKIAESANSRDLDEVAQNEPPHLDLHCLPFSL